MSLNRVVAEYANKVLGIFGLKIARTEHFPRDWRAHFQHISGKDFLPSVLFDVGVATKTEYLYDAFPGAKIILVEPLEEYLPALRDLSLKYSADIVTAAAGATVGSITINVPMDIGGATIYNVPEMKLTEFIPRNVAMTTLDLIWEEKNLSGATVVKLDVQGAELDVLRGAKKVLQFTELLIVETNLFESFEGAPIFADHIAYMSKQGFIVYDIIGGGYTFTSNRLGFVDLVYVKRGGVFDSDNSWFSKNEVNRIANNIDGIKRK